MTTKAELIQQHNEGNLPAIASQHITNTGGIALCHIEHGTEERIFGYVTEGESKRFYYVKLKYLDEKISFKIGNATYYYDDFMRL